MNKVIFAILLSFSFCLSAEEVQKVEVKKKKDGTNVYNFNFYHGDKKEKKDQSEVKQVETQTIEEDIPLPQVKKLEADAANGVDVSFFYQSNGKMGNIASPSVLGLFIGYQFNSESGSYLTPGVLTGRASADGGEAFFSHSGSVYGGAFKIGKFPRFFGTSAFDFGAQLHAISGDLDNDIFGDSYSFTSLGGTLYAGPVFKRRGFRFSALAMAGASQIDGKETYEEFAFSIPTEESNKKITATYGVQVSAVFNF